MEEGGSKGNESDIDIYCDLEGFTDFNGKCENPFKTTGASVSDISTLFSENECKISFSSEDGKKTKIKITKRPDFGEGIGSSVTDFDLFTDVVDAEVTEKYQKAEQEKLERRALIAENIQLKQQNSDLIAEVMALKMKNHTLMKNICSLYKTAKEEIYRKDALIAELREKNDGLIFRRTRLLGTVNGAGRWFPKNQGGATKGGDSEGPNGRSSELKNKDQNQSVANSCISDQPTIANSTEPCFSGSSDVSKKTLQTVSTNISKPSVVKSHKCDSEPKEEKKLPKAFQDPPKRSRRRHSSHKTHRRGKKFRKSNSAQSGELTSDESSFSDSSSGTEANSAYLKTLRKLKSAQRYYRPVLSKEELCNIYSDYQRLLPSVKKDSRSDKDRGNANTPISKTNSPSKGSPNCDSEEFKARDNFLQKLLSFEKLGSVQESKHSQRRAELRGMILSASNAEHFSELYTRSIVQQRVSSDCSSFDADSHRRISGDYYSSSEHSICDDNNGDYEDENDYDFQYNYSKGRSSYVDLDKPHDDFYSAPPKCFYDHLMEEKARQAYTDVSQGSQTKANESSSKAAKTFEGEKVKFSEKFPPNLKEDSLKLFSYQRSAVPVAVKKRVLGYAKSPKKITEEQKKTDIEVGAKIGTDKVKTLLPNTEKSS